VRDEILFANTDNSMVCKEYWFSYFRIRTKRGKKHFSWKLETSEEYLGNLRDVGLAY